MTLLNRLLHLSPFFLLLIIVLFWEEFQELFFISGVHYIGFESESSDELVSIVISDDDEFQFDRTDPAATTITRNNGTFGLRGQGKTATQSISKTDIKESANNDGIFLPIDYHGNNNETFCVDWKIDSDLWWTHHPEWSISNENQTHYCFSKIQNEIKASLYRRMYNLNYKNSGDGCSNVQYVELLSKGWGADLSVVNDMIFSAVKSDTPIQLYAKKNQPWHYAAKKDGSHPVCPRKDIFCYFLNISSCNAMPNGERQRQRLRRTASSSNNSTTTTTTISSNKFPTKSLAPNDFPGTEPPNAAGRTEKQRLWWWIYEYVTRPQTWLRRDVYAMAQTVPMAKMEENNKKPKPCVAMHVRRGDVVLETGWKRKYYDIDEYIEALHKYQQQNNHSSSKKTPHHIKGDSNVVTDILLLTDDQNAIGEALLKYNKTTNYHWMYLNRHRFKGSSGGYENQIPSDDPRKEVVAILTAFQLVRQCDILVHTQSHFSDYLYHEMVANNDGEIIRINLDKKK